MKGDTPACDDAMQALATPIEAYQKQYSIAKPARALDIKATLGSVTLQLDIHGRTARVHVMRCHVTHRRWM